MMTSKIQAFFIQNNLTLSTAESCTGGNMAHQITKRSGSSGYFLGTIVSYANEIKSKLLKVAPKDLQRMGAVSETVAIQMVQGIVRATGSDYGVATTGIAGPGGGSDEKPVGTVWIGVGNKQTQIAERYVFEGSREEVIQKATDQALEDLWLFVSENV